MSTILITRHQGTRQWVERMGFTVDLVVAHLDAEALAHIQATDRVLGTLPAHLAAAVCERGAEYFYIAVDAPPDLRGIELSADQLETLCAYLVRIEAKLGERLR